MPNILCVGAGAVGSYALEFVAARLAALEIQSTFVVIDHDEIDNRNFANQFFSMADEKKSKAEVMASRVKEYRHSSVALKEMLTVKNIEGLLEKHNIHMILDMVDNLKARELSWMASISNNIPCIHASVSKAGHGKVIWSVRDFDHFNSGVRAKMDGNSALDVEKMQDEKDPPCKLIGFSGLCIQTGMATAKAVTLYHGKDPEAYFGGDDPPFGTMLSFLTKPDSHEVDLNRPPRVFGHLKVVDETTAKEAS